MRDMRLGKNTCSKISGRRDRSFTRVVDAVDGILIPGGFGSRGMEGKIRAVQYARKIRFHS